MHVTPSTLVQRHLHSLLSNLKGAFDGDVESVHQARVATRRLREAIPLLDGDRQGVVSVVRSAGRHLGRVRELDAMSTRLDSLGSRIPTIAAEDLHRARQAVQTRRLRARRQMVKALERLDLWALPDVVSGGRRGRIWRWVPDRLGQSHSWTTRIWDRIAEQSRSAVAAAQRTPAIYFPNRAHGARVEIKKLRYAVEVVADAGLWQAGHALKDLRRLQSALGDVHDLQVLGDTLVEVTPPDQIATPGVSTIRAGQLEDDLARRYADYIKRRDRVFMIAAACERVAKRQGSWRIPVPLVAASVITAPVLIESIRTLHREKQLLRG